MAETGKPIIISTGMADARRDRRAAVAAARETGNEQIIVLSLHGVLPGAPGESNLRAIPLLRGAPRRAGRSLRPHPGHRRGGGGGGARRDPDREARHAGPATTAASTRRSRSTPASSRLLVRETDTAWQALGSRVHRTDRAAEAEGLRFRRSLYVVQDVRAGDAVTPENVRSIRPAGGLEPAMIDVVLGRTFRSDAPKGTPLTWNLV